MYNKGVRGGGVFTKNYKLSNKNAKVFKNAEMTNLTKPVSTVGKWGGIFGKTSFGIGIGLDIAGLYKYAKNPDSENAVSPAKVIVNTGIGVWGMGISRIGLRANPVVAIMYSGVDAFYPGGWTGDNKGNAGALENLSRIQKENQAIVPNWKLFPKEY